MAFTLLQHLLSMVQAKLVVEVDRVALLCRCEHKEVG